MMEYDVHTVLDFLTLGATAWVIYMLRLPLKDTYQAEQDSVQSYYVVSLSPVRTVPPQEMSGHPQECGFASMQYT